MMTGAGVESEPLKLIEPCHGGGCHAAVAHHDSFGAQPARLLQMLARRLRKSDAPARAHHAVPWQVQCSRCDPQRKARLPCPAGQSRRPGDRSVGRHLAARNRAHNVPDRLQRRIVLDGTRRPSRPRPSRGRRPKERGVGPVATGHRATGSVPNVRSLHFNGCFYQGRTSAPGQKQSSPGDHRHRLPIGSSRPKPRPSPARIGLRHWPVANSPEAWSAFRTFAPSFTIQPMQAEMGRQVAGVLYVVAMAAVIVGVDFAFFRNRFWERLIVNIGIVLVFAAFYLRFLRRP